MPSAFDNGVQVRFTPLGHHQLTVSDTAVGLPEPSVSLERVRRTVIRPFGADIAYRDDGADPSGDADEPEMPILDGEVLVYDGLFPMNLRLIRHISGTADVRIAYYGT
jgi:hypothetical protein